MKNVKDKRIEISRELEELVKMEDNLTVLLIKEKLRPHLNTLINLYEKIHLPQEDDWQSGEESYGYESDEDIINSIRYISDRWGCSFRIRWMIDLLDPEYYANKGVEI
jgi:hypothetical protein